MTKNIMNQRFGGQKQGIRGGGGASSKAFMTSMQQRSQLTYSTLHQMQRQVSKDSASQQDKATLDHTPQSLVSLNLTPDENQATEKAFKEDCYTRQTSLQIESMLEDYKDSTDVMELLANNLKQKASEIAEEEALTLFEVNPDINGQYIPIENLAKNLKSQDLLLSSKIQMISDSFKVT